MGLFTTTPEWDEAVEAWQGIADRPAKENRKRRHGFPVLQNRFLERYFATSHWAMPGVWFGPVIAYCLWAAFSKDGLGGGVVAACMVAGILGWTLAEYLLHRFFFHLPPGTSKFRRTLLFAAHGYHHEFPDDPGRLVAPPVLSWPIGLVLGLFCWATMGIYWHAVFAGVCTGYLAYDWVHYYTHHGRPTTRVGKFVREFHQRHHYQDHDNRFGLSSPLWDVFFGTLGKNPSKANSERTTSASGDPTTPRDATSA